MIASILEQLKAAAPLLAILLPAIAAYFAYRLADRRPSTVGMGGVMVLGGALADRDSAERHTEAINSLVAVINSVALALNSRAANDRTASAQAEAIIDQLREIRRAIEDAAPRQ